MSEGSFSAAPPRRTRKKGHFSKAFLAVGSGLTAIISQIIKPLGTAAGLKRARKFHQDVVTQMSLTIATFRPEVEIGTSDPRDWYTEIYLNFRDLRIRITRAIYDRRHYDFWADVASRSDPAGFFRIDFVIDAIRRLDKSGDLPECSKSPNTLIELDATLLATHDKLAEHLSAARYVETSRMVRQVMLDHSGLSQGDRASTCTS